MKRDKWGDCRCQARARARARLKGARAVGVGMLHVRWGAMDLRRDRVKEPHLHVVTCFNI